MPVFKIRGVEVHFPFQPYDVQMIYMEKVIESLQEVNFLLLYYCFRVCFIVDKKKKKTQLH